MTLYSSRLSISDLPIKVIIIKLSNFIYGINSTEIKIVVLVHNEHMDI